MTFTETYSIIEIVLKKLIPKGEKYEKKSACHYDYSDIVFVGVIRFGRVFV